MGLLLTLLLGCFLLGGAVLAHFVKNTGLLEQAAVSVAVGSMTVLVALDLIPEAMENMEGKPVMLAVFALLGMLLLKLLDLVIPEHDHAHGLSHDCSDENLTHIGIMSAVGVGLHNLIEGMAVYSICAQSTRMGLLMSVGVGLHNLPMGMVIYATLEHELRTRKIALLLGAALSTFAGGVLMALCWQVISESVIGALIALTLGMLLYIILFELLPHLLHAKGKGTSALFALLGAAVTYFSTLI